VHHALGRADEAAHHWRRAFILYRALGSPEAATVRSAAANALGAGWSGGVAEEPGGAADAAGAAGAAGAADVAGEADGAA